MVADLRIRKMRDKLQAVGVGIFSFENMVPYKWLSYERLYFYKN